MCVEKAPAYSPGLFLQSLRDLQERHQRLDLRGTFLPFFRASDRPMAIACLRLLTFPPLPPLPLFSVPFLRRLIALFTSLEALREYLRAICCLRRWLQFPIKTTV